MLTIYIQFIHTIACNTILIVIIFMSEVMIYSNHESNNYIHNSTRAGPAAPTNDIHQWHRMLQNMEYGMEWVAF